MAMTVTLLGAVTFNTNAGDKTVVATPTLGRMVIIIAAASGLTTLACSDNNPDGHGSYTQIVQSVKNTSADALAAFVRADPTRSATSTTYTASQTGSSGGGLAVFEVAGADLAGAAFIRRSGKQDNGASAGTPTIPLGAAALTTNALIAAVLDSTNSAPAIAVPAGFAASVVTTNYNTPANGIQINIANSGVTASTITYTGTAPSLFGAIAIEMSAAVGDLAVDLPPEKNIKQALNRASVFCLGEKWAKRGKLWIPAADRPYTIATA